MSNPMKTTMTILLAATLLLAGCEQPRGRFAPVEASKRIELFQQCMDGLPAGPEATKYNDWDEVVLACDKVATLQAAGTKAGYSP